MSKGKQAGVLSAADLFGDQVRKISNSHKPTVISKQNVYREKNLQARALIHKMLDKVMLPGSCVCNFDNLAELYRLCKKGYSCLILLEHYSNVDFPALVYLLQHHSAFGKEISEDIIPMAAMKLNEENPMLSTLTDAYTHISIFPARRVDELALAPSDNVEMKKARAINLAALKKMRSVAQSGKMILMFPSGTRYKPNDPQTKRVVKAADSFMKRFDYVIFGGIAGNTLIVNDTEHMLRDYVHNDNMVYLFSPVHKCKSFRKEVSMQLTEEDDLSQHVSVRIEQTLQDLHVQVQSVYDQLDNS